MLSVIKSLVAIEAASVPCNILIIGHYDKPLWVNVQAPSPVRLPLWYVVAVTLKVDLSGRRNAHWLFEVSVEGSAHRHEMRTLVL